MSDEPQTYEEALGRLKVKARAFVEAYAGNASAAALQAGYVNGSSGARLLKNAKIKRALALRDAHEAKIVADRLKRGQTAPTVCDEDDVIGQARATRLERAEQVQAAKLTRQELECFLAGVVTGEVLEHGVTMMGQTWSGPPKLKDRLKAAEMLAKMNHWNTADGGGGGGGSLDDPYGHGKLSRSELESRAKKTARALVMLDGGKSG